MGLVVQAVILAGGLGTRLRPITYDIPKPMVPINGRPFLEYQIELLLNQGIKDIVLCVGYLREKIIEHFKDGADFGVNIQYSIEKEPIGTGGALRNAGGFIEDWFFLLNSDTYLNFDYMKAAEVLLDTDRTGLIVVYSNRDKIAANNISLKNNIVLNYDKNTENPEMNGVDAGVSVYRKNVLKYIPPKHPVSFETEVVPLLIAEGQLLGWLIDERFYDIGTPEMIKIMEEVL